MRRDVECGRRLVRDENRRLEHERHGDHRPLPLSAGQLVGIGGKEPLRIGQVHIPQEVENSLAARGGRHVEMDLDHLFDLTADLHHGVECRHRLLEDHGDASAADLTHSRLGRLEQVFAFKQDAPPDRPHVRLGQKAQDRSSSHRLARSGLADDAQDLIGVDRQR